MDLFMQYLITGFTIGSVYALLAIGFVTIYNVTGVLNLAQGEFAMLGAMISTTFLQIGLSIYIAIPFAILTTACIGFLVERFAIHPIKEAKPGTLIVITLGVSIFIKGVALLIWGTTPKTLPPLFENKTVQFLGAVVNTQSLLIFLILAIHLVVLYWFFEKTFLGSALRASEQNKLAASLMGINVKNMSAIVFAIAAALGALAGAMIAPLTDATYDMGFFIGIKGFVAMVFGGMHRIQGAVAGGLLLGMIEAFSGGYISTYYTDAIAFGFLLLILFVRPQGLFSRAEATRV